MVRKRKIAEEDLAEKRRLFERVAGELEVVPADEFLKDNFLPYAWSYNLDRALVDVTGLKPVQRRLLFSMFKDGLSPRASRSKVASLAGRVLAYHPHGDASVADALKNMARHHIFRVPMIDGKGDFGVPGTPGAAPRYIEARLNEAGWINVEEIGQNAVRMVPNYDNTREEPVRLPVRWPVSVINGGSGIAIAYAANMPSHNPTEVMNACKALLVNPEMSHEELAGIILGPDFNMGGEITSNDGVREYLATGSGSFRIRGRYDVKPGPRGTHRIEFYEIPFGTFPEKVILDIQKAAESKGVLKDIATYKDLSDLRHPIRIVIDTKPGVNHKKVIAELFKHTCLEVGFAANITTVIDSRPQVASVRDLLLNFIEFRKECVASKSRFSMGKKKARLHLVNGLLKVLLDIDKAIAIIRKSEDTETASAALQKAFRIDGTQAEHVLSIQLRRLTKMDQAELNSEKEALEAEIAYLGKLLTDEDTLREYLLNEFTETEKIIGDERRTEIRNVSAQEAAAEEKAIARELKTADKNLPCYITRFADGRLMRSDEPFIYAAGSRKLEYSPVIEHIKVKTQDQVIVVASNGTGYRVPASYIPAGTAGDAVTCGIQLGRGERIVAIAKAAGILKNEVGLMLASKLGEVKICRPEWPNKEEFPAFKLNDGDEVIAGRWLGKTVTGTKFVSITSDSYALVYDAASIRPTGVSAGGVRSQKVNDGQHVVSFTWVQSVKDAMAVSQADATLKLTPLAEVPPKGKGSMGVVLHKFRKGESKLRNAYAGPATAVSVADFGNAVPLPPASKRAATGTEFGLPSDMGSMLAE